MTRPLRIQLPGLRYHVTSRRCERAPLFNDSCDNLQFLEILGEMCSLFYVTCYAYCLMVNHFHLVIQTDEPNLARAMHRLNGKFAQWWNRRHLHAGHVLEHRYDAQVLADEVYFVNACRYAVQNPIRAKHMVQAVADWPWSSYRATVGLEEPPPWLHVDALLCRLGDSRASAVAAYRRLVDGGSPRTVPVGRDVPVLGDDAFRTRYRPHGEAASHEVTRWDRLAVKPALGDIFASVVTRADRDAKVTDAFQAGYNMAEIARFLQLHYSTVSRILTRNGILSNRQGSNRQGAKP